MSTLIENLPQIFAAGSNIILSLSEGIMNFLGSLTAPAVEIVSKVVQGIRDNISDVIDVGKNIVEGIWDGIKSVAKWLGDQVSGFFGGIVDSAKDFLGIASPSKVFAGIGANMAAGLGVGFENEMNGVAKKFYSSIPTDVHMQGSYTLEYHLSDGSKETTHWRDRSRRESWTDEMRQAAREKMMRRNGTWHEP